MDKGEKSSYKTEEALFAAIVWRGGAGFHSFNCLTEDERREDRLR